jgi:transcriptional antiterminator RfaH
VSFGTEPAKVDADLVELLQARESSVAGQPVRLFNPGERVRVTAGPFAGIEGIYQMAEGERRVIVLIELLSKMVTVRVEPASLRKAS